jgi:ABC-2 type transport system ATP-binding protein
MAIRASGLTKRYGSTLALDRLDLEVRPGEVYGYLGPNGAGKTTTIRLLLGLHRPTAGRAELFGVDAWADPVAAHRRVAYVAGEPSLWPGLTGAETLQYLGRLHGSTDDSYRDALLDRFQLDPSRKIRALSKGNRQKVGIVQALCHDPDVLILDEPTTGLDPLVQREFLALVGEAAGRGAAVLFSSHVLPEVERVATRVAIIRAGQLVTVSTVDDLLDRARRRMELRFAAPVPAGAFDGVAGVAGAEVHDRTALLAVDGPVGPALRAATDAGPLLRVNPAGDDLEDLFVSLYQRGDQPMEVSR